MYFTKLLQLSQTRPPTLVKSLLKETPAISNTLDFHDNTESSSDNSTAQLPRMYGCVHGAYSNISIVKQVIEFKLLNTAMAGSKLSCCTKYIKTNMPSDCKLPIKAPCTYPQSQPPTSHWVGVPSRDPEHDTMVQNDDQIKQGIRKQPNVYLH